MPNPVTMNAAIHMCATCGGIDGANMPRMGLTFVSDPSGATSKPTGLFIHAFAATTKNVPAMPARIIGTAHRMCARGDRRLQPNR